MMHYFSHSDYYRDRASESELCYDFPGDVILIDGLHAMQMHFWRNSRNIDIPVVRVMNAAHYIVAYLFQTSCSGDQNELDTLAYMSIGGDKQLMLLTMVVLAAMLKRTEGFRARQCRSLVLEDRSEDFEEGVTFYEHFLSSAEERFAEEDFLIDIPTLAAQLREKNHIIEQQHQQITQLQYILKKMDNNQQNIQYNIYQAPVYRDCSFNDSHDTINNHYYPQSQPQTAEDITTAEETPSDIPESIIFTKKAKKEGNIHVILQALQHAVDGRNDKTRAFVDELRSWQKEQYIDAHFNARIMYDELDKLIPLTFGYDTFRKYYNNLI